jgi:NUMOD4 motif-containing protein/HNH endonuclease
MRKETWKNIDGYEGIYQVSTLGRMKSLKRETKHSIKGIQHEPERIMKLNKRSGYYIVGLYKDGKGKCCLVHRLVATAFIPNPDNKPCINHKNSKRDDSRVENLEWCTYSENTLHAFAVGAKVSASGFENSRSKPIVLINEGTNEEQIVGSQRLAAKIINVRQSAIWRVLNGVWESVNGYKIKYAHAGNVSVQRSSQP